MFAPLPAIDRPYSSSRFSRSAIALLAAACALSASTLSAQDPQAKKDSPAKTAAQSIPPVTTTVEVHGESKNTYMPETLTSGTLDNLPLTQAPLSATVVTRAVLNDQDARLLSDVVKNDASIGEDYAPVGYYGDYEIRGFPIDLATGLKINGLTVAGEQEVPLENKESVQFLEGASGIETGVASAGGVIDFVTKRPALITAADTATDQRGSVFGAIDLGRLFGSRKQLGARVNLAGERIQSYVNGADGWRAMGAGAADWHISPKAILKSDFEYQHKDERSVCGYQLLGGDTLPDINRIYPSTMLGFQSWAKPNIFDTFNTGARLDYDLPAAWHVYGSASLSHSLIDDNVVYAYGCGYEGACLSSGGTSPDYFFAADGGYDIYDYRNPGELRINAVAQSVLTGRVRVNAIQNDIAVGGELFRRSVQMPGYYSKDAASTDAIADGSVYYWVGSENIYQPIAPVDLNSMETPHQNAGPRRLWEDDHQASALLQDRLHLPGHIQLTAGGRVDSLHEHNYSSNAADPTQPYAPTSDLIWLPQYAASWNPINRMTLYGNYSVQLSLGPQAPWWAGSGFLAPFRTRQAEVGAKFEPTARILATAALFHMRAPFFYASGSGDSQSFVSQGHETHDGVELNAQGRIAPWLQLTASATAMRAEANHTGTPSYDNKQVINVPHLRTAVFADVAVPHARGLHVLPGWGYTGRKEATYDDTVSVTDYHLFNLGARYTPGGEQGHVTLRLYADNIANKRYWKDTGANYGDTFIHLGAPATVRMSAHYRF